MNRLSTNLLPLPTCLEEGCAPAHRRHLIGSFEINASAMARFNDLLAALGHPRPIDRDQLVTAARSLCRMDACDMPVCLRQRLWHMKAAVSMAADGRWEAPHSVVGIVRLVAAYVASNDDLIPDVVPTVGRLDDAIAVDAAWPTVSDEVCGYIDFRRLRRRVVHDRAQWLAFDRERWLQARLEQQALDAQLRRVRSLSYVPARPPLFHVA